MAKVVAPFSVRDLGPYKIIMIESGRIDECMAFYVKNRLDGVGMSPHHGYDARDLSFLEEYPFVQGVALGYGEKIDVSSIRVLKGLRLLVLGNNTQPLDLSAFPDLEDINIDWHRKVTLPRESAPMKRLELRNYKPRGKDLRELPEYANLEEFELIRSPIQSLAGLERFKKLKRLSLYYLSKLEGLAALQSGSLEYLHCDVCKKICDHEHVTCLKKLRVLHFANCGTIPSLAFLRRMPKLEEFSFVDTDIEDGDLTPCLDLKRVGFLRKKHYSHTPEEVDVMIAVKQRGRK